MPFTMETTMAAPAPERRYARGVARVPTRPPDDPPERNVDALVSREWKKLAAVAVGAAMWLGLLLVVVPLLRR